MLRFKRLVASDIPKPVATFGSEALHESSSVFGLGYQVGIMATLEDKTASYEAPRPVALLSRLFKFLAEDFLGGPRWLKAAWVINFQKGGTFAFYGILIAAYHNTNIAAWILLAMHGTYGLIWLMKSSAFPDPTWNKRITFGAAVNMFVLVLGWYWFIGWLLISRNATPLYPLPSHVWFCLCITLCIFGCTLMIAADAQKYFTLRVQRGLITDGVYRYIRHPNYLGEMIVYLSFALMVWQWRPFSILACVWGLFFSTNMVMKEARMSRYPGWAAYKQRSWWLLPGIL